jgi:hypothetical protein
MHGECAAHAAAMLRPGGARDVRLPRILQRLAGYQRAIPCMMSLPEESVKKLRQDPKKRLFQN